MPKIHQPERCHSSPTSDWGKCLPYVWRPSHYISWYKPVQNDIKMTCEVMSPSFASIECPWSTVITSTYELMMFPFQVSNDKKNWLLGYTGDEMLASFIGIIITYYKDRYWPTSKSRSVFFPGSIATGWKPQPFALHLVGKMVIPKAHRSTIIISTVTFRSSQSFVDHLDDLKNS